MKTYPYISPPSAGGIVTPLENEKVFQFYNYTENNTNYFAGYEIYYKFYSADSNNTLYESEREILENTPTLDKLVSLNFDRLYNYSDDPYTVPLIPVDSEDASIEFPVEIDFRFLTETIFPDININNSEETIYISRYVKKGSEIQNSFYNFMPEDISSEFDDISSSVVGSGSTEVLLSLYVLSYGKYEVFNELYSKAAHLGKIKLQTINAL